MDEEEATEEDLLEESDEQPIESQESEYEQASEAEQTDRPMEDVMSKMLFKPEYSLCEPPPIDFDFELLMSFHHFCSSTQFTLPSPGINAMESYWQAKVLPLALSRPWMMSGLLAISDFHVVALADDESVVKSYSERAMRFFAGFLAGRRAASLPVRGTLRDPEDKDEERRVGGQIMCVLRCAHWALMKPMLGCQRSTSFTSFPFNLQNFHASLRSFTLVERNGSDGTPEEVFARASQIFRRRDQSEVLGESEKDIALLGRLDKLPSRMSNVFGRPDNLRDVMATLAAIATLVEHYSVIFTLDMGLPPVNAVWHSMVQWLSKVPENFKHMVSRHEPAALVVVAFWVSALVSRAEQCGYWFLQGLAHKLQLEISGRLRETEGALSLIDDLFYKNPHGSTIR
ncbi:hypothetical protein SLS60_000906 [Paraconiothyrium brasiliense]|uniref:Uncharacterized protein n=1 Tax=Paraconiothyrium brasiliense TaxID=300254 RepID=A0ABR3S7L2_9PLEO